MKRRLAVYAVVLATLLFALIGGGVPSGVKAEAGTGSMDVMVIDNEGYKADRKGPVTFTHKKHAKDYRVSCWDCHHEFKDGKNVWAPWENTAQCSECHDPQKDQGKAWNLQKAFHMNCKNCHQGLAAQKKKTGPYKKCFGCHKDVKKK